MLKGRVSDWGRLAKASVPHRSTGNSHNDSGVTLRFVLLQPAGTVNTGERAEPGAATAAAPANGVRFIHCCCEPGSTLSKHTSRRFQVEDVTKEDDFTKPETLKRLTGQIRGPGDVLFYSSPCTGGSGWQRINLGRAKATGDEVLPMNLVRHYDLHWRLWVNFEKLARHCANVGATVLLEWPRYNDYWKEPRVASFLQELGFKYTDFDGCMYGLRPSAINTATSSYRSHGVSRTSTAAWVSAST